MFKRRIEAYDSLDAAALAADYTDDCIVESPYAGTHVGRAAVEKVLRNWFNTFLDMKIRTRDLIIDADANRVVQVCDVEGTDLGGFLDAAPTGRLFREPAVFVFELRDQQIIRERRIYDRNVRSRDRSGVVRHDHPADRLCRRQRDQLRRVAGRATFSDPVHAGQRRHDAHHARRQLDGPDEEVRWR